MSKYSEMLDSYVNSGEAILHNARETPPVPKELNQHFIERDIAPLEIRDSLEALNNRIQRIQEEYASSASKQDRYNRIALKIAIATLIIAIAALVTTTIIGILQLSH